MDDKKTSLSATLSTEGSGDWSVPLVALFYSIVTKLAPDFF
ncbi:hypothetical protein [Tomitella gaofuii]|nr:hypothetical protein [Tomitella gaofuii]